jgi:hypothetical protein
MRVYDLQKKYPELWERVESVMLDDIAHINKSKSASIPDVVAKRIAHNAAFMACSEHHKLANNS